MKSTKYRFLVDNILPKDVILDYAFIDVEALDIECLEGMK